MDVLRGSRRRMVVLILLLLVVVTVVMLSFRGGELPSVILLPANANLAPKGWAFDRWVPMSWAWYWRAKDFVLGHSKTVVIDATFVSVPPRTELVPSFSRPVKTITNLHIYFVGTNESARMYKHLTSAGSYSTACRIATAHGIETRLFSGQSTSRCFSLAVLAKRRSDCTDLCTSIEAAGFGDSLTTAITNLAMAARLQIPKDHDVFILKSAEHPEDPATLGVILRPKWK